VRRTRRLGGKVPAHTPRDQLLEAGPAALPLLPEEAAKAAANPLIKTLKYAKRFTETELVCKGRPISLARFSKRATKLSRIELNEMLSLWQGTSDGFSRD
jgi:hypothetical protein